MMYCMNRVTHELRTPLNGIIGSVEILTNSETIGLTILKHFVEFNGRRDSDRECA